jgi:hypothetical protein
MEGEYDEDKLIFWSNGGPGASSMFGFMTEVGPFSLNANSLTTDEVSVGGEEGEGRRRTRGGANAAQV